MGNEVVQIQPMESGLPITHADLDRAKQQREMLMQFIRSQLKEGIDNDYAVIPGTKKKSLLKPGAEKLLRLFNLGVRVRMIDKEIDRGANLAIYVYKAEVFNLRNNCIISECEASANSQETKYKERRVWRKNSNGVKEMITEETPIFDILNTLMKMAQKRAIVGATLLAVGGSDIFTQDIDDEADAEQIGMKAREDKRAEKEVVSEVEDTPSCCGGPMMISKYDDKDFGEKPWYCPRCKNKKARAA